MEKKYFLNHDGNQSEPLSIAQLKEKYITSDTLVWTEGQSDWVNAGTLDELKSIIRITPPPISKETTEGLCTSCGEFKESKNAICWSCNDSSDWIMIPTNLTEDQTQEFITNVKKSKGKPYDVFAVISLIAGIGGFLILPILFIPIGYIASIVSYYRLRDNKRLQGGGFRVLGAILTTANIFWIMYQFKIGFFA